MHIAPDSLFVVGADRTTPYTYLALRHHELQLLHWAVRVAEDHAWSPEDATWLEMAAQVLEQSLAQSFAQSFAQSLATKNTQQADQRPDDRRHQDEAWRGVEPELLARAATDD